MGGWGAAAGASDPDTGLAVDGEEVGAWEGETSGDEVVVTELSMMHGATLPLPQMIPMSMMSPVQQSSSAGQHVCDKKWVGRTGE